MFQQGSKYDCTRGRPHQAIHVPPPSKQCIPHRRHSSHASPPENLHGAGNPRKRGAPHPRECAAKFPPRYRTQDRPRTSSNNKQRNHRWGPCSTKGGPVPFSLFLPWWFYFLVGARCGGPTFATELLPTFPPFYIPYWTSLPRRHTRWTKSIFPNPRSIL